MQLVLNICLDMADLADKIAAEEDGPPDEETPAETPAEQVGGKDRANPSNMTLRELINSGV